MGAGIWLDTRLIELWLLNQQNNKIPCDDADDEIQHRQHSGGNFFRAGDEILRYQNEGAYCQRNINKQIEEITEAEKSRHIPPKDMQTADKQQGPQEQNPMHIDKTIPLGRFHTAATFFFLKTNTHTAEMTTRKITPRTQSVMSLTDNYEIG